MIHELDSGRQSHLDSGAMTRQPDSGRQSGTMNFVNSLNDAIRDNPLAAGLVGAGVCWMLFSKVRPPALGGIADAFTGAASAIGTAASSGAASVAAGAGKVGSHIADAASQVKDAAGDFVSAVNPGEVPGIVAEAGETVMAGVRSSAAAGKRYGASAQQVLSENLERQPLLLGAIGLAIGAGIAAAFPSTKIEGELMGEQGSAAREKLQSFAEETKDFAVARAGEVLDAVKDEAKAQGLTPQAAKDAFNDLSQKAKGVADSARGAVTSRTS